MLELVVSHGCRPGHSWFRFGEDPYVFAGEIPLAIFIQCQGLGGRVCREFTVWINGIRVFIDFSAFWESAGECAVSVVSPFIIECECCHLRSCPHADDIAFLPDELAFLGAIDLGDGGSRS